MGKGRLSQPSLPGDEAPTLRSLWSLGFVVALAWALFQVARQAWTTDDAYISFRYAANLNDGLGLVYNAGERVEGYSNFLWTLWCAVGLELGVAAEAWTQVSGGVCYFVTLVLLAVF